MCLPPGPRCHPGACISRDRSDTAHGQIEPRPAVLRTVFSVRHSPGRKATRKGSLRRPGQRAVLLSHRGKRPRMRLLCSSVTSALISPVTENVQ